MLNDLFSQVPEDEIDFSLFEDADDNDDEGLGAVGRKRRKRTKKRRGTRGVGRVVKLSSLGKRRKKSRKRRRRRKLRGVGTIGRKTRRRRRTVGTLGKTRRRRRRVRGIGRARSVVRRNVPKSVRKARKRYRRARKNLARKSRSAGVSTRKGQRRYRKTRAFSGTRRLGFFSPKESKPIIGGFNWVTGKEGMQSLGGIVAGGFISGLVEEVVFEKLLGKVKFLYPRNTADTGPEKNADGSLKVPVARPILAAAISSIAGWEIGKLAKSKDFSKFAFLYPWGKLIENLLTSKAVEKISEIGAKKPDAAGFGYSPFGQLRVPDSTELDGLGQLRVPDATELDGYGLGQLRVPELDGGMEGVGAGVGQYDVEDEDEDSDVF